MKEELTWDTKDILVELRAAKGAIRGDYWALATVTGGIDKMTVKQKQTKSGLKTTIEITSLDGTTISAGFDRAKQRRARIAHKHSAAAAHLA